MSENINDQEYVSEERIVKCKRATNFWEAEVDPENVQVEFVDVYELRTVYKDENNNIVMWEPEATIPFGTSMDELLKNVSDINEALSKEVLDESEMGPNPLEDLYSNYDDDDEDDENLEDYADYESIEEILKDCPPTDVAFLKELKRDIESTTEKDLKELDDWDIRKVEEN